MSPQVLLNFLRRRPFRPFRLYLLEQTIYVVRHPEQIMVGRTILLIDLARAGDESPAQQASVVVALAHVSKLEWLP